MKLMKIITILQIILLLWSLVLSTLFTLLVTISKGLGRAEFIADLPGCYLGVAMIVFIGLCLKFVFRKNKFILPIAGILSSIGLLACKIIIDISAKSFVFSEIYFLYYGTIVLTLVSSVWGLLIKE